MGTDKCNLCQGKGYYDVAKMFYDDGSWIETSEDYIKICWRCSGSGKVEADNRVTIVCDDD